MTESRPGPLAGLRIVEVGHMLAGPYCGLLLADLGAEVTKIETAEGDIARNVGPHRVGPHNAYFASLNRSKKSVVLDLASADGRQALEMLVRDADGLVTNLRPSAIKKLGLTYDALCKVNPRIACLALTGYGLESPWADRPAYDYVIQALTGIVTLTSDPSGPPVKAGYSVVDNAAGVTGAFALVSMIHGGRGGQLDVSMFDVMLSQLNYLASAYLNAGQLPEWRPNGAHPYIVPAQFFATADGHLMLFISHDEFWRRFAGEVGRGDWLEDARFSTMRARSENRDLVLEEVAAVIARESTRAWIDRLSPLGIVVAGVESLDQALDSELTRARRMVAEIPADGERLRLVASPIRIAGCELVYRPPPLLGEHNPSLEQVVATEPPARSGNPRRALARALSRVADASVAEALQAAEPAASGSAWRIGVTGAPGSGKSSLIARLAPLRLARLGPEADQLAVIAVDPSSPMRHGAILGDRVRMDTLADDPRIYIRSLASRGSSGGLTHNIVDVMALADANGFAEVLLETVGVGQAEHAVRELVDSLVLVLHPEAGDSIQAMKSGIMELADVYVVNKADLPGAERTAAELRAVLKAVRPPAPDAWTPPVVEIGRGQETGLAALDAALEDHRAHVEARRDAERTRNDRRRYHLQSLVQRRVDEVLAERTDLLDVDSPGVRYAEVVKALTAPGGVGKPTDPQIRPARTVTS